MKIDFAVMVEVQAQLGVEVYFVARWSKNNFGGYGRGSSEGSNPSGGCTKRILVEPSLKREGKLNSFTRIVRPCHKDANQLAIMFCLESTVNEMLPRHGACFFSYPLHPRTGSRGYFANRGSVNESWHCRKVDPLSDVIKRACTQCAQRPNPADGFDSESATRTPAAPALQWSANSRHSPGSSSFQRTLRSGPPPDSPDRRS
jgi:hypothetical protein